MRTGKIEQNCIFRNIEIMHDIIIEASGEDDSVAALTGPDLIIAQSAIQHVGIGVTCDRIIELGSNNMFDIRKTSGFCPILNRKAEDAGGIGAAFVDNELSRKAVDIRASYRRILPQPDCFGTAKS
nr:hypothetical protein [uncultured Ruegeria sp.]